ncbi:unnamed protein product [Paramecium sonneborni]|uniref:Uncharacterized protein n=1 Tax=Paramecium sonneborni TaxID=65129 RepID=A0A8S1LIT3_9CILI|nr:unnamed protein product [Paramecium sonneborni]
MQIPIFLKNSKLEWQFQLCPLKEICFLVIFSLKVFLMEIWLYHLEQKSEGQLIKIEHVHLLQLHIQNQKQFIYLFYRNVQTLYWSVNKILYSSLGSSFFKALLMAIYLIFELKYIQIKKELRELSGLNKNYIIQFKPLDPLLRHHQPFFSIKDFLQNIELKYLNIYQQQEIQQHYHIRRKRPQIYNGNPIIVSFQEIITKKPKKKKMLPLSLPLNIRIDYLFSKRNAMCFQFQ